MEDKLYQILLAVGITLGFLLLLPILGISFIVKSIVSFLAKFWDEDIDEPVGGNDIIYALTNKAIRSGFIVTFVTLENGTKDTIHHLREMFSETIMREPELYKRLCQYFVPFGGFPFWKTDTHFSVSNHIRDYDHEGELRLPSPCYFEDLPKLVARLQTRELAPGRSPWEFLVVRDVVSREDPAGAPVTALLLRTDHILGDGLSIISAGRCLFRTECSHAQPSASLRRSNDSILGFPLLDWILLPLKSIYDFAHYVATSRGKEPVFLSSGSTDEPVTCAMTPRIDFQDIKRIQSKYNVSITTVLQAINFEATVRTLREFGSPSPSMLSASILAPLPNRPKRLGSFMTGAPFNLAPEGRSSEYMLYSVDEQLKAQARVRPTLPLFIQGLTKIFSSLPTACRELLVSYFTGQLDIPLSTLPVTSLPQSVAGLKCIDFFAFLPAVSYGIQGITVGGNGTIRFTYAMKNGFPQPDALAKLCSHIVNVKDELLLEPSEL